MEHKETDKIQKVKITGKKECQVPTNFQQKLQKKKKIEIRQGDSI